jgi:Arylsulfotransferase (ASST)
VRRRDAAAGLISAVVLVAGSTAALPASAARRTVSSATVTASPGLLPAFSPSQPDYAVRCNGATPVSLAFTPPAGASVSVDGESAQQGRSMAAVRMAYDAELTFTITDQNRARTYYVRCLPPDFPQYTVSGTGSSSIEGFLADPSLGSGSSNYLILFDAAGVPIWWTDPSDPTIDATITPTGQIAYEDYGGNAFETDPSQGYQLYTLGGTAAGTVHAVGGATDTHEFQVDASGDYDLLSYRERKGVNLSALGGSSDGEIVDCVAEIVSPAGKLLWSWDAYQHLGVRQFALPGQTADSELTGMPDGTSAADIYHCNSMQVAGQNVLLSFRHLDAVFLVDRKTGAVVWKLGGTPNAKSLVILGDTRPTPLDGQHDARLLPDGSVSVHDNSTFSGGPPRMVRYRIDAARHTATLVQQIVDPTVQASGCCGSARTLPGGDVLVDWGETGTIGEYTPAGTPFFRLTFASGFSYRATPVPLGSATLDQIRAGMNQLVARS